VNRALRIPLVLLLGAGLGTTVAVALHRAFPVTHAAGAPGSGSSAAPQGSAAGSPQDSGAPDGGADADAEDADIPDEPLPKTMEEQRERLFARMLAEGGVTADELQKVRAIFDGSTWLGQGNPDVSVHPMTRRECLQKRAAAQLVPGEPALCGKPHMVPIFDPAAGQTRDTAPVCIDQYEFPDIPCEYPVVNVRANEAAALCRAVGKRLCDAHEWEGACAGAVHPADTEYLWNHDRRYSSGMHNFQRQIAWAYGPKKNHAICATHSFKTKDCPGGGWKQCGSNTYPAGAFPECKSVFGVYDQHGNAAEHMNLPTRPEELMSRSPEGGFTEMKGSWFIFSKTEAHLDDCRWREPSWHESRVSDPGSHRNYHLGFRCCKDR
jgi:hypothetical protein